MVFSNCASCSPPKIELCIHNEDGSAECEDRRLPDEERQYNKEPIDLTNHVSTNPQDFNTLLEACERWKNVE